MSVTACVQAGVVASLAALLVFLVAHHIWIKPIWFIVPPGLVIAGLGGAAVGWSYHLVHPRLAGPPWTGLSLFALVVAILLPAMLLSFTHGPLFDLQTATIPPGQGRAVALRVVLELLLTATLAGALVGWRLGGTRQAILATALAGLSLALGPGHNIPMFGNNAAAWKGFALLFLIVCTTAWVLPPAAAWLDRSR